MPNYRPTLQEDFNRKFDLSDCWRTLLFGLSFFHSIIQERRKFGSLGWNIRYEFNDSDLDSSIKMLQNFIFEAQIIPWDSILFMTGFINYGGRVTDDNDRILLMSLLENCYGPQILNPNLHEELLTQHEIKRIRSEGKKIPLRPNFKALVGKTNIPHSFKFFRSPQYTIP